MTEDNKDFEDFGETENVEKKPEEVPTPPPAVPQINSLKKYVAELIGTLVLVLIGCGASVMSTAFLGVQYSFVIIPLAFGFAVLAMFYAFGEVSGCHINPAVSISMLVAGKINVKDTVYYIVFQCVGAIIGAGILYGILKGSPNWSLKVYGLGANGYGSASLLRFSLSAVFLAEVVLTFIFVLTVFGATHEKVPKGFSGITIGFAFAAIYIFGVLIDGGSVNPARSLGPAIFVSGTALSQVWVFWVAPIIGGILAAIVWKLFK